MSTTVTMDESGLVQLPEVVRKLLKLEGAAQLDVDVRDDGVRLRPHQPTAEAPRLVRNSRGRLVIAGDPEVSESAIVQAIKGDRNEREDRILAYRHRKS